MHDLNIGVYDFLRYSGSLGGGLTRIDFATSDLDLAVPFFAFLPEAASYLVFLSVDACTAFSGHPESSPLLPLPQFPALRTLALKLDCDMDAEISDSLQKPAQRGDVLQPPLRARTFPVLSKIELEVINAVNHAISRTGGPAAVWNRFGEVLVTGSLPAIKEFNFELCDKQKLTYVDARVDCMTGVLFTRFICKQMPAATRGSRGLLYKI
ncbi:hypothetical protein K466DRAFT_596425 [Polyporus arcularius HHB13444]|uniref:Uncharacterized protein n=1 Tax=Polyporus arcularius HHB13444 TaxID=1314778 RepID=A0A5C3PTB2_9APHY|nr:hypothetical protein K466DRAFT_596425 [Polyporus arcularius HHB13444]